MRTSPKSIQRPNISVEISTGDINNHNQQTSAKSIPAATLTSTTYATSYMVLVVLYKNYVVITERMYLGEKCSIMCDDDDNDTP